MKKSSWLWIGLFIVLVQYFYLPTRLAGFVTDFTGLAERIETHGAAGILSSFGFPALQPLTSIFYFFFYHTFSLNGWGWYLCFTLLHSANGIWLFFLVRRLLQKEDAFPKTAIAAVGALLFLLSPYAAEVVVWRVGFHYLLVTFWTLGVLWNIQSWLEQGRQLNLWLAISLQFAALLTYELAIFIPLASLLLLLWQSPVERLRQALYRLFVPQVCLVVLYFLANRLFLGAWIGHYGSEVHLRFPLTEMLANIGRYFVKWAAFSRYWDHSWKEGLAVGLIQPAGLVLLVVILAALLLGMICYFRRSDRKAQFSWVFALGALIFLSPVLNLYYNYLLHIENDRYGYLPTLFFYPALAALMARLPKWLFLTMGVLYLSISCWLLQRTNTWWAQSTAVYRALLQDFDAYDRDTCYLLNLPDNLQGAPMFRDYSGHDRAFLDALQYVQGKSYEGTVEEVVQYNMVAPGDGVQVARDSNGLKVTFHQWGNWWWRRGIGAASYRDSSYIFKNEGHHYLLEWRRPTGGAKILYQVGVEWMEVE